MEKVTAIIPTFNRFKYLMNTIKSMKEQTYDNMEIIVVNDCSTEKEYYEYNWEENGIIIIHLEENSKKKFEDGSENLQIYSICKWLRTYINIYLEKNLCTPTWDDEC
jgi:cellulose synthase/poly-beta-1,6-N-acetylglucosamine synthase-like glycosyltransferase